MVVLGRIKPDSGTKKQVSESNSNLMPLVSQGHLPVGTYLQGTPDLSLPRLA